MPSATILIVEDEERVRSALRRSLRRTTHDLLVAESGNAALALLEQEAVDVILSDDCMPGMSGIQLLRQARLVKPCAARLMLTDRAGLETAMEAVRCGDIDRFLTKPWADGELREALDTAAEKVRAAAAARAEEVAAARRDEDVTRAPAHNGGRGGAGGSAARLPKTGPSW